MSIHQVEPTRLKLQAPRFISSFDFFFMCLSMVVPRMLCVSRARTARRARVSCWRYVTCVCGVDFPGSARLVSQALQVRAPFRLCLLSQFVNATPSFHVGGTEPARPPLICNLRPSPFTTLVWSCRRCALWTSPSARPSCSIRLCGVGFRKK